MSPGRCKNSGYSLIELLIAMTIGLILLSAFFGVLTNSRKTSDFLAAKTNLQENARFALDLLSREIRLAAFKGCLDHTVPDVSIKANDSPTPSFNASATSGFVVDGAGKLQASFSALTDVPETLALVPHTHVLLVQYANPETYTLQHPLGKNNPNPNADIVIEGKHTLKKDDLMLISNCDHGDVFRVSNTKTQGNKTVIEHGPTHNSDGSLSYAYGDSDTERMTLVSRLESNLFYIAHNGKHYEDGAPILSLYKQPYPYDIDANPPLEIIQGVENLKLQYGLRDGDGNLEYFTANESGYAPSRVVAIRIGLLLHSDALIAESADTHTYRIAEHAIKPGNRYGIGDQHANDKRMRLAVNSTVQVRNRSQ